MDPTKIKLDALAYLLGGVALLATAVLPLSALFIREVQPIGKVILMAYWLLGAGAIWWAVRRFRPVGERVAALVGVVVGWYIVLQMLFVANAITSGF